MQPALCSGQCARGATAVRAALCLPLAAPECVYGLPMQPQAGWGLGEIDRPKQSKRLLFDLPGAEPPVWTGSESRSRAPYSILTSSVSKMRVEPPGMLGGAPASP